MKIRSAQRDDVSHIVALLADDDLGTKRENLSDPPAEEYIKAFELISNDPNQQLAVAEIDGQIVGTLQLTFIQNMTFRGGRRTLIEAVRVHRDYRSQGLGKKLFEWAKERAIEEGCHLVQLTTNSARKDAHRFYESLGFEASHVGMKCYVDGDVTGRLSLSDK